MNSESDTQESCRSTSGCCGDASVFDGRRQFLKATGLTAAILLADRTNVMAGPFSAADFQYINCGTILRVLRESQMTRNTNRPTAVISIRF